MAAKALAAPPAILSTDTTLAVTLLDPGKLFRVSGFVAGEPHFGATGGNRFDAPGCLRGQPEYQSCYLGLALDVAIAESLLHDALPFDGAYPVAGSTLLNRYVHRFTGTQLRLPGLHGALLKRMAGHADLAGTTDYSLTQSWALAVFNNPFAFDGFVYMSRHLNTGKAMLFDRAAARLTATRPRPLLYVKGFAAAARAFNIVPA